MHQHSIQIKEPYQIFLGHYHNIIIQKVINLKY